MPTMSTTSDSWIEIDKDILYRRCWEVKKSIFKKRMKDLKEAAVEELQKPTIGDKLRNLMGMPVAKVPITKKDYFDMMRHLWRPEYIGSPIETIRPWHIGNWGTLNVCKRLIKLCKLSTGIVHLSSEDADYIF